MLATMLRDPDLDNARLALTTLISAIHNKPSLLLPDLHQLLPPVMKASYLNPALIREVQMGPFKHKVDDGLELRKVCRSHPDYFPPFAFFLSTVIESALTTHTAINLDGLRHPLRAHGNGFCAPQRTRLL